MSQFLTNERYGNGQDGVLTISSDTADTPVDSACTGTSGTKSLSATNASFAAGQIILIHQTQKINTGTGTGQWEINIIQSYTAGTITTKYDLDYTYTTGAQVLVVKQYSGVTVQSGKTLTAKAWNGTVGGIIALICNGSITVSGSISATGKGFRLGPPGNGGIGEGFNGEGQKGTDDGLGPAHTPAFGCGAGGGDGGGGNRDGAGGGGGGNGLQGTSGANSGDKVGGTGGDAVGSATLVSMFLGGGGGAGAGSGAQGGHGGSGANGGGIILLINKFITVTGSIVSNGSAGSNGSGSNAGGGGGGAGGSILLKGKTLTLGSGIVTASGGAQGSQTGSGGVGGAGAVGRIHADYGGSVSGSTSPTLDSTNDRSIADPSFGFIT